MTTAQRTSTERSTRFRLTDAVICLAAFTASWTATAVGGSNVVDYLLAVAVALTVIAWITGQRKIYISGWMLAPVVAAIIVTAVDVIGSGGGLQGLDLARVFLATTVIAVLLTSMAATSGRPILLHALRWWAAGVAVNALAAIAVSFGLISFYGILYQPTGARGSGLSSHPNSIAFSITLAIPALIYFAFVAKTRVLPRLLWLVATVISVWGLYLSDSRAGWIVAIPTISVALALAVRRSRFRALTFPIVIIGGILAAINIPPLFEGTRLVEGSAQSDSGRTVFNNQAIDIFLDNPIFGGGFDDQIGVAVPLMVISAGGIILALAYYLFILWPLPTLWRERREAVAQVGILSLLVFLAFGLLNPVFVERATLWPILIPALWLLVAADGSSGLNPWRSRDSRPGR